MRRAFLKLLAGGALLGPAAFRALARAAEKKEKAAFKVTFRKAGDTLDVVDASEGPVLRITSKSGIGGAKFTQTAGPALKRISFEFVGMKTLESFTVSDGTLKLA